MGRFVWREEQHRASDAETIRRYRCGQSTLARRAHSQRHLASNSSITLTASLRCAAFDGRTAALNGTSPDFRSPQSVAGSKYRRGDASVDNRFDASARLL